MFPPPHFRVSLLLLLVCSWACRENGGSAEADGGRTDDAALALDGGDATADPRCSPANCQNLFACGFALPAAPDVSGCARRSGHASDSSDGLAYCPAACNAGHAGPELACLAASATMCSLSCSGPGSSDPDVLACSTRCDDTRSACRDACPASSYRACLDCTFQCSVAALSCYAACDAARDGGRP